MKTLLTRIHLGLNMPEVGAQFHTLDEADKSTSKQRCFLKGMPDELASAVWAWARGALDEQLSALPVDLPPANVTTALMQQRNAEQMAEKARAAELAAKESAAQAEALAEKAREEKATLDAMAAAAQAEKARLDLEAAKKQSELAAIDAALALKKAEADALDSVLVAMRAEADATP
jgi:hypothetical protein